MKYILALNLFLISSSIMAQTTKLQTATLGSGCFWCTEAIFERVEGVSNVQPGFSGGDIINPSYKEVVTGRTGHAEVVQFDYDPAVISYPEILEIYFKTHDPTQLNRQGNDIGTQYRSVIFYHNTEQKKVAEELKSKLDREGIWNKPIVTAIEAFSNFYKAEDYHNDYYANNPNQGYCQYVITPKVEKFEKVFKSYLKE
ncbi:MAG TPA: peptide-methionine (S)-S-oxide reductase [Bacteroidales bacterium]|jgi:peptide-methionine (S)-S-oxide reductase|nr:peptide-methionine (S)-S-oxide reductase [Bacteroidales bacterium]